MGLDGTPVDATAIKPMPPNKPRGATCRIGALVLARATTDPRLRDEILRAAKRTLIGSTPARTGV
jgi:hypothetical protein